MSTVNRALPLLERFIPDAPIRLDTRLSESAKRQITDYLCGRLSILFNASGNEDLVQQKAYPYTASSVLNFGVVNLAGMTVSGIDTLKLSRRIRDAILRFEPRIDGYSLQVSFARKEDDTGTLLNFIIEGTVSYQWERFSFSLNSRWNTDSGEVQVLPFYSGTAYG
ncbi:hypothetical protein HCO69_19490 [Pantoea sp. LS15]|uniref:type VI secretion system baseplate subunit TssE n=1 Tax=Enterobacterales TaxID=91347 RepID=UPI000E0E9B97|nr:MULTISPECIES: GPW/gp25 family protein [Enterobacterales]NJQ21796.1 hypothetical protein [Pantoea sp. LS15]NKF48392.1 hypothetical protein [Pantoea sp. LS15]RDK12950.1 hypothetical protein CEJ32_19950 [Enterobacter sp. 9-2]